MRTLRPRRRSMLTPITQEARGRQLSASAFSQTTSSSHAALLTREEEALLVMRAQAGMALEQTAAHLAQTLGRPAGKEELAQAAGLVRCASTAAFCRANALFQSVGALEQRMAHGHQAKQLMVEHNIRLVISIASRHLGRGMELSDLVQEGAAGLVRGVEKFDPSKGCVC